jgi:hypothetical protein
MMVTVGLHVAARLVMGKQGRMPARKEEIAKLSHPIILITFSNNGRLGQDNMVTKPFMGALRSIAAEDRLFSGRLFTAPMTKTFKVRTNISNFGD